MNRKGFTMIELILVIAILGILAVSALPKFLDLADDAHGAARDGVAGAVRSGIALSRAENLVAGGAGSAPASLDNAGIFGNVLVNSVPATDWSVAAGNTYTHTGTSCVYTYNITNGTFQ